MNDYHFVHEKPWLNTPHTKNKTSLTPVAHSLTLPNCSSSSSVKKIVIRKKEAKRQGEERDLESVLLAALFCSEMKEKVTRREPIKRPAKTWEALFYTRSRRKRTSCQESNGTFYNLASIASRGETACRVGVANGTILFRVTRDG